MLLKHYLERGVSKAALARRFGVSRRTLHEWIESSQLDRDLSSGGARYSPRPPVPHKLDPYAGIIDSRLEEFPELSAKRLFDEVRAAGYAGSYSRVRDYVRAVRPRPLVEPVVRFETPAGRQGQVDFGTFTLPWGRRHALVVVLSHSRLLWLRFYRRQTMAVLTAGLESAFERFGGVPMELLFDQMRAVVLSDDRVGGGELVLNAEFLRFAAHWGFHPRACRPYRAQTKGSVEGGVKYVRNLVFRPRLAVESWAALNAAIITELEADLPMRHLDDGRSVEEALSQEREHLRAMPAHLPATCRVVARVADKFGHVHVDRVTYSVPIRHAYRPVWVKLYHDRVAIAVGAEVVAEHRRVFCRGAKVLDALHVLPLLERKHRAVAEATALLDWRLAPVWQRARAELAKHTRKPDQEWVRMLRLMETHPAPAVERAVTAALERHSPRLETVRLILRQQQAGPPPVCPPVAGVRPELARIAVPTPTLSAYDALVEGSC